MRLSILLLILVLASCDQIQRTEPKSTTGVSKATATVNTGSDGLTVEQRNVKERLERENRPGSIKHLYVISAMSGQVLIYSTVKGKVTSSGKRLSPTTVVASPNSLPGSYFDGFPVTIGGRRVGTSEVLQDDGTYGLSIPYLYWFDVKGNYHQHYVSGGQIIHVSEFPLNVKSVVLNVEKLEEEKGK